MTGKPSVLQSMGSQRVGHDWVTEQQRKSPNTWILTNLRLHKPWFKEEVSWEIEKCTEPKGNETATHRELWITTRAVLKGKFRTLNHISEKRRSLSQLSRHPSWRTWKEKSKINGKQAEERKKEQTSGKQKTKKIHKLQLVPWKGQ